MTLDLIQNKEYLRRQIFKTPAKILLNSLTGYYFLTEDRAKNYFEHVIGMISLQSPDKNTGDICEDLINKYSSKLETDKSKGEKKENISVIMFLLLIFSTLFALVGACTAYFDGLVSFISLSLSLTLSYSLCELVVQDMNCRKKCRVIESALHSLGECTNEINYPKVLGKIEEEITSVEIEANSALAGSIKHKYPEEVTNLSFSELQGLQQKQQSNLNMTSIDLSSSVQCLSSKIKQKEVSRGVSEDDAKKILISILQTLKRKECIELLCDDLNLEENFLVTDFQNIKKTDLCRLLFISESRKLIKFNSEIARRKWIAIIVENFTINGVAIKNKVLYNTYSNVNSSKIGVAERLLAKEILNVLPTGSSKQLF